MSTVYNIWKKLIYLGVGKSQQTNDDRHVILTNRLAIISSLILLLLIITFFIASPGKGWNFTRLTLLFMSISLSCVIFFNHLKYYNVAKQLICWLPVVFALIIVIVDKAIQPESITLKEFVFYRFLVLVTAVFPFLIYPIKSWRWILLSLIPSFVVTVFGERIHSFFGVGMTDFHIYEPEQTIMDIMIAISYVSLVGFIINLRLVSDNFERKAEIQRRELSGNIKELNSLNTQISSQNIEIMAQSDDLKNKNGELLEAHKFIDYQREQLEEQNRNLENQIKEKAYHIIKANDQLALQNNELQQFSFTISHKLRSPVVTLKGLLNLVNKKRFDESNHEVFNYIEHTLNSMEFMFSDLNDVISLREDLYQQKEYIQLNEEIDTLRNQFYADLMKLNIKLVFDFGSVKKIYSNRQKFTSILYNLISNSIKYRSNERDPKIEIVFGQNNDYYIISVMDNGLGIDLKKHGSKVFQLFQRFHPHIDGKGLGLYLVKSQSESLGGHVTIDSKLDKFTNIQVFLKKEA